MAPRAFFVLGPESSGTRLVTSILIAGGCHGSAEHLQPFDDSAFGGLDPVVLRRSVPHNGGWLNGQALIDRSAGYKMAAVVVVRDWHCNELSQVTTGHAMSREKAGSNIGRAYYEIFNQLWNLRVPFTVAVYESLILHPRQSQRALLDELGLEIPDQFIVVTDEDAKHWEYSYPPAQQMDLFETARAS